MDETLLFPISYQEKLEKFLRAERFCIQSLSFLEEPSIVAILEQTLNRTRLESQDLSATKRRLPEFYQSYQVRGASYLVLRDRLTDQLIGGGGIRSFAGLDPSEGIGELCELVISKPYRGLGLGRMLLEACLIRARQFRYKRIYLETSSEMEKARELFHRCGFQPVHHPKHKATPEQNQPLPSYYVLQGL